MQPLTLTPEELTGLASAMSQLACFQAVLQGTSGAVMLETQQLVDVIGAHDPVLAGLVSRWCESARELREHVIARVCVPRPAAPFRVSPCGHAM